MTIQKLFEAVCAYSRQRALAVDNLNDVRDKHVSDMEDAIAKLDKCLAGARHSRHHATELLRQADNRIKKLESRIEERRVSLAELRNKTTLEFVNCVKSRHEAEQRRNTT